MTTLADLRTTISRALYDPNNATFTTAMVDDEINNGIIEVGRIAPRQFLEDVTGASTQAYDLEIGADSRIRPMTVEIWKDGVFVARIPPHAASLVNSSQAGWRWWAGQLHIPYPHSRLVTSDYDLRVLGYAPYTALAADEDETDLEPDKQEAVREYAIYRLSEGVLHDRLLFKQWQVSSNNTDVTMGALLGMVDRYRQAWERRRRQLATIRELGN